MIGTLNSYARDLAQAKQRFELRLAARQPVVISRQSGGQVAEAFGSCFLCAGACRGHGLGNPAAWEPEWGSQLGVLLSDPCDEWATPHHRPKEPCALDHVRYRGWEVGWSSTSEYWCGEGWIAYKGGCDLGAPEVRASTYQSCLDEIDNEEDGA